MVTKPDTTYIDLRTAIQNEKNERIQSHQARVLASKRIATTLAFSQPIKLNLIAQGDSWFDYPLPVPIIHQSDVIAHLKNLPLIAPEVLSLAHYGETAEDMLGVKKYHELFDNLADSNNGNFDAILFSGGGNDFAGEQFRLWINDESASGGNVINALNTDRVNAILEVVKAGYIDLINGRDKLDRSIPIFAHSYDWAIPNGEPAPCGVGPWMMPSLHDRGWNDLTAGRAIVKNLLLKFSVMLDELSSDTNNNFIHVKTQGTLLDSQWANELHPTPDGFAAITAKFVEALRVKFPGRI